MKAYELGLNDSSFVGEENGNTVVGTVRSSTSAQKMWIIKNTKLFHVTSQS